MESTVHQRPVVKVTSGLTNLFAHIDQRKQKRRKTIYKHTTSSITSARGPAATVGAVDSMLVDNPNSTNIPFHMDVIGGRYKVMQLLGQGSVGNVFECYDLERKQQVAVKITNRGDAYQSQAKSEIETLQRLRENDPDDKFRIVCMLDTFMLSTQRCIVFELLNCSLYDLLRNTNFRGISLNLTRKFARQLLNTLQYIGSQGIIHCDLKLENIMLVNGRSASIKVIDFGSSCTLHNQWLGTKITSLFYRAPEVMMCLPYDTGIDMWSLACVLVEMYTGKPLFSGRDTYDQMRLIVQMLGMPPQEMVDESPEKVRNLFFVQDDDREWMLNTPACGDTGNQWPPKSGQYTQDDGLFWHMVQRMLQYQPEKRFTPEQAFNHPFCSNHEAAAAATASATAAIAATAAAATATVAATAAVDAVEMLRRRTQSQKRLAINKAVQDAQAASLASAPPPKYIDTKFYLGDYKEEYSHLENKLFESALRKVSGNTLRPFTTKHQL